MKLYTSIALALFASVYLWAQNPPYEQQKFCNTLYKIFESGRKENFESLIGMNSKQSPFLQVPGPNVKLEHFPVLYVDKDNCFTGKTNLNMDSASAVKKLEELKPYFNKCLDSTEWIWLDFEGDDSTTTFFKEAYYWQAFNKDLTLTLASVHLSGNAYSATLFIRRNRR